jgi:hypothetical protein
LRESGRRTAAAYGFRASKHVLQAASTFVKTERSLKRIVSKKGPKHKTYDQKKRSQITPLAPIEKIKRSARVAFRSNQSNRGTEKLSLSLSDSFSFSIARVEKTFSFNKHFSLKFDRETKSRFKTKLCALILLFNLYI